nr:tetratricopeptide repeat protein [Candidatus Paceibacterota bacterium]
AMKASFTAMFAAYFVHVMFVFDSLTSYIVLFLILAFIHSQVAKPFKTCEKIIIPKHIALALALLVLLGTPFAVWGMNAEGYIQNKEILKAIRPASLADVNNSLDIFEKSLARNSFGTQETLTQLIEFTAKVIRFEDVSPELKQKFVNLTASEIQKYIEKNPQDSRTLLLSGAFIAQTGNFDTSLKFFESAIAISPKKQFMYQTVIEILFQKGNKAEALALAKQTYEINIENDLIWGTYVKSSLRAGDEKLYKSLIEEAFNSGKGYRVIDLSKNNLEKNPEDSQAYASLAVAYYRSGDSEKAIEILDELSKKFPQAKKQSDFIVEKIKAGEPVF